MRWVWIGLAVATLMLVSLCGLHATVFGTVRGIVHDPQHRPIVGARVTLKSATSAWSQKTLTNSEGEFSFPAVSFGDYTVSAKAPGFAELGQSFTLASDTSSVLHLQLSIAAVTQTAVVTSQEGTSALETFTPTTLVDRETIERTPGADLTNSLAMITDFTPAAYMTHDMLHMRGGHQTSWLIDGVPIPDTNIATSLAPRVDPQDIDYVEILRGSYDAQYGDRTYGMFNILPKSGFDMNNDAELVTTVGSFYQTDDQLNFGGHTRALRLLRQRQRKPQQPRPGNADLAGLSRRGERLRRLQLADLQPRPERPAALRWAIAPRLLSDSLRSRSRTTSKTLNSLPSGLRDHELETDGYALFSWVHTFNPNVVLTVSPFYHYNNSGYHSPPNDMPVATTAIFSTNYGGGQAVLRFHLPKNDAQVGVYSFAASQNETLRPDLQRRQRHSLRFRRRTTSPATTSPLFASDKFSVTSWLTLIGGVRATHFSGGVTENTTYPRIGGTLRIPHVNWVFRAFWGRFYQPPPLVTLSGPLLRSLPALNDCSLLQPLHGERDEEHQFGVTIPDSRLVARHRQFRNARREFPRSQQHRRIEHLHSRHDRGIAHSRHGTDDSLAAHLESRAGASRLLESDRAGAGSVHRRLDPVGPPPATRMGRARSRSAQHAQRRLQRHLAVAGFVCDECLLWLRLLERFPRSSRVAVSRMRIFPGHAQVDLSLGKEFGERFSLSVTALNVANRHLLIDNSLTFGGFHYDNPREIYVEFRWRFHY